MEANEPLTLAQVRSDIMMGTPFIFTVTHSKSIRNILTERGYTDAVHRHGVDMLARLVGNQRRWSDPLDESPTPQREALDELDRWDNRNFAYAQAALEHHYPEQADYVFKELRARYGIQSMLVIRIFLERIRNLREGLDPYREESREADRAAVRLLEERNILSAEVERRLAELIELSVTDIPLDPEADPDPLALDEEAFQELARDFRSWIRDWRKTARTAIKDRRYLIRLGLSKPRKPAKAPVTTAAAPGGASGTPPDCGGNSASDGS